jgi:hypothetical protein
MKEHPSLLKLEFKPLRVLLFDPAVDTASSDIKWAPGCPAVTAIMNKA